MKTSLDGGKMAQQLRRKFYLEIVTALDDRNADPKGFFRKLCTSWSDVTSAEWTWLWLQNVHTNKWEIVGASRCSEASISANGSAEEFFLPPLPNGIEIGHPSIAELALIEGAPISVADVATFRQEINGRLFEVRLKDWFLDHGVSALDTIPFVVKSAAYGKEINGAICCHYKDSGSRPDHADDSIKIMGALTAQAIANLYETIFFQLLMKLNSLASRHLTKLTKRPDEDRAFYLSEVTKLIQKHVGVTAVSFFYREPYLNGVSCLSSTGLGTSQPDFRGDVCSSGLTMISNKDLSRATYESGELRTGKCFASGVPLFMTEDDVADSSAKFLEIDASGNSVPGPVLIAPIPKSGEEDDVNKSDGVVRCAGHPSHLFPEQQRSFGPMETQTVLFVCQQISPILHTFASRIQREHQISLIKHDLDAPVNMIADTASRIRHSVSSGSTVPDYRFLDLEMACAAARNLSKQLEADPNEIQIVPERVFLERDIIAGCSAMLGHFAKKSNRMDITFHPFKDVIPYLWVDKAAIERVFYNLIVNAVKYGTPNSTIHVYPRRTSSGYAVDVSNEGMGIRLEDSDNIFRPYFRSQEAQRRKMGLGLGLYIARVLMRKHGGDLKLTSNSNPTVFSMMFPELLRRSWDSITLKV